MQYHEMRFSDFPFLSSKNDSKPIKTEKEAIHSGHFMVSHFEAEAQDDEYEVAVPVPEIKYLDCHVPTTSELQVFNVNKPYPAMPPGQLAIETSLTKLFQCMSLAYRQKLTSPKWNRFKGIRLRWKDKIRLNNVIWRCWHMQFIKKENTLICQFASPLDEGTHNKPEAVVLEGKYWKRKLAAVTAEYKKWRMFYRSKIMGWASKDSAVADADTFDWKSQTNDITHLGPMMVDEDYMELMSDTLFSTITSNQPFAFPDTREIARGANLADFIQPSLVQLQPNLEDFMDTIEPLQEFFSSKLPPVPEDCAVSDVTYRPAQNYTEVDIEDQSTNMEQSKETGSPDFSEIPQTNSTYQPVITYDGSIPSESVPSSEIKTAKLYQSKERLSQLIYSSRIPAMDSTSQAFISEAADRPMMEAAPVDSFSFENDSSQTPEQKTNFSILQNSAIQQQTFKFPTVPSKVQQPQKVYQYYKAAPVLSVFSQCNRIQQNYDLTNSSGSTHLSDNASNADAINNLTKPTVSPVSIVKDDTFVMPRQHLSNLKSRPRTRSGSSLVVSKTRTQPPQLSSTNSDPALNIQSALLAQLLTNNSATYNIHTTSDRFYSTSALVNKSTNIPILPMPPKISQQSKIMPKPHQTLSINSAVNPIQKYANTTRSLSSPNSPKDSTSMQSISSSTGLSQSPKSLILFSGSLSPSKICKQDMAIKTNSGLSEHRRVSHINAEQKRRYNIKNGFDVLHSLIPHLNSNPNLKLSKAAMLQKGAEYIRQLQAERLQVKEDMEGLRCQIESLNNSISNCQSLLPATGAPVSRHRTSKMREMFDEFVRVRTMENWKFWIFSILFEPLLHSFSCSVSTASYDDLYRSTLIWVEQHCSLVDLRPGVLNSLRNLCTTTEILSDPSKLPDEARTAVMMKKGI